MVPISHPRGGNGVDQAVRTSNRGNVENLYHSASVTSEYLYQTSCPKLSSLGYVDVSVWWQLWRLFVLHESHFTVSFSHSLAVSLSLSFSHSLSLSVSLSLSLSHLLTLCLSLAHTFSHSLSLGLSRSLFLSLALSLCLCVSPALSFSLSLALCVCLALALSYSLSLCLSLWQELERRRLEAMKIKAVCPPHQPSKRGQIPFSDP